MNCDTVGRDGIVELYLSGKLPPADSEDFELHYFSCARCFEDMETVRALAGVLAAHARSIRAEASRPAPLWMWPAAAVAMAVLLAVGVRLVPSAKVEPKAAQRAPAPSSSLAANLTDLALVEPAPYTELRLRGSDGSADAPFREAMSRYVKGDYHGAAAALATVVRTDAKSPAALFYLGVADLMDGRAPDAATALEGVVALGDSPYLEQAEFYLGKAYLRQNDREGARRWWKQTVDLHGDREAEARSLLARLP